MLEDHGQRPSGQLVVKQLHGGQRTRNPAARAPPLKDEGSLLGLVHHLNPAHWLPTCQSHALRLSHLRAYAGPAKLGGLFASPSAGNCWPSPIGFLPCTAAISCPSLPVAAEGLRRQPPQ